MKDEIIRTGKGILSLDIPKSKPLTEKDLIKTFENLYKEEHKIPEIIFYSEVEQKLFDEALEEEIEKYMKLDSMKPWDKMMYKHKNKK